MAAGGRPRRRADGGTAANDWVEAAAGRRGRMCLIASFCFCAIENCWAKFSRQPGRKEALTDRGVEEPNFVGLTHICHVQPQVALLDH